jgi:hypothetical protein
MRQRWTFDGEQGENSGHERKKNVEHQAMGGGGPLLLTACATTNGGGTGGGVGGGNEADGPIQ